MEAEESLQPSQKRRVDKSNDRTYNIIMNENKHRFHLRYVVYSAGVLLGFSLLYKYNKRFRLSCQQIVISYRCGQLFNDFKNFVYSSIFGEESTVKNRLQTMSERYNSVKGKIMDTEWKRN